MGSGRGKQAAGKMESRRMINCRQLPPKIGRLESRWQWPFLVRDDDDDDDDGLPFRVECVGFITIFISALKPTGCAPDDESAG